MNPTVFGIKYADCIGYTSPQIQYAHIFLIQFVLINEKKDVPNMEQKWKSKAENLQEELDQLRKEHKILELLIENSTDAIQISDKNLVTLRINRAYELLTGINRQEVVGIPVQYLVDNLMISESCGSIVAKTKKAHTIIQSFYRTGRQAHVSCNPVFNEQGEIEYFICNDRDLGEISKLHSELHKLSELKDRYFSELEAIRATPIDAGEMIVHDQKMLNVLALANKIAKVDSTVLILGETGVGKDELARFIHQNSFRAKKDFVSINCAAIAESLFESELFGHESNAFTGAGRKMKLGLLEVADGGTIFLDEIGELSLPMQTKLLHVLQSQSFIRVGGNQSIKVNCRFIAATNCDLLEMVKNKQFREDLYYRLNVVPIRIPPLRERKNDIIPLAQHFLSLYNERYGFEKKLSPETYFSLLEHHWEGNIRELKNYIEYAVILTDEAQIGDDYFQTVKKTTPDTHILPIEAVNIQSVLEQTELRYLNAAYQRYGNMRDAAAQVGFSTTTFARHLSDLREKYPSLPSK